MDSNSDIKLCPNPKCDALIELPGHGMKEIKCQCGYFFCFKCLRESHRPCAKGRYSPYRWLFAAGLSRRRPLPLRPARMPHLRDRP